MPPLHKLTQYAKYVGRGAKPSRAYEGDAGFDLAYSGEEPLLIEPDQAVDIPCGIGIQWPSEHMWGLMVGRSSTFRDRGLLVNLGVIDAGFRGELFAVTRNISLDIVWVMPGDRVAQIIPLPLLAEGMGMMHMKQLDDSERGTNGFGSSGR